MSDSNSQQDLNTLVKETLQELEALGNERTRAHYKKAGASDNLYGVKLGDLRKVAKKVKKNHELALALWNTENVDARFLAILIIEVESLTARELEDMVCSMHFTRVADWLNSYVVCHHPDKEKLRLKWLNEDHPMLARSGWNLTASRITKNAEGLDLDMLLGRIESEMGSAAPEAQWTMNFALAYTGIHFPEHRERAIAIGEALGLYQDYPVSKGCTSPFAPIWIKEMVSRQS